MKNKSFYEFFRFMASLRFKQFLEYSQADFVDSISSPYIFSLIIGSYNKSFWICSVYLYTLKIFKFLKFTKNENIRKVFKYF